MTAENAPPEGCLHYTSIGEVPWDVQKYWHQRRRIFSKYDKGIWMTDDAWFGVTPEPVAKRIADHLAKYTPPDRDVLFDIFAGAGGNTIAFARSRRWKRIIAIEKDARAIACAKHNAAIYGVADGAIEWVHADCFDWLRQQPHPNSAVIFASPPWGGPGYSCDAIFNLHTMQPYPLRKVYDAVAAVSDLFALYLPRTSDLRQLAALVPAGQRIPVTHYCMHGASKALCAYFGALSDGVGEIVSEDEVTDR